jgi:transposase
MGGSWWLVPDALGDAGADLAALTGSLRAANARLREIVEGKDAQLAAASAALEAARAQIAGLAGRVAELERRLGRDSLTSSRPPSSDSPYAKITRKSTDRSLRGRSGRRPGKQPGAPSATLRQSATPDAVITCAPAACAGCGGGLAGAVVTGVQKLQEFEVAPPPRPRVTEYQVQARACGRCGTVTAGQPPAGVTSRVQYGPAVHAQAANLACAHYLPLSPGLRS